MKIILILLLILAATGSVVLFVDIQHWETLDTDRLTGLNLTTFIYDSDGQITAGLCLNENRIMVELAQIPPNVRNAFIAIEDARFYNHPGIDLWRIGGAAISNLKAGEFQEGASTITQQLIKLTHLSGTKTLSRKLQEARLALQLERIWDKDAILCAYLNTVYFGKGAYGIEAAARAYFDKACSDLTLAEAALLAGIVKAPGRYAPHLHLDRSIERRNLVLHAMEEEGFITPEEMERAEHEELILKTEENKASSSGSWYADWVLIESADRLNCSIEDVLSGGYQIYTALNPDMQAAADMIYSNSDYFPGNADDGTAPQSALIAMCPDTGEISCMIGGRDYSVRLGLNRAMQIKRQPGSTLKPISTYAAAIDYLGYTPLTRIDDVARDFGGGYSPSNASGKEYGTVTLRQALSKSMNLATVDLLTKTGIETACLYASRAGIPLTSEDHHLSVALGSLGTGVSPAELCAAYAPLTNGGTKTTPHTVRKILNQYGDTVYECKENAQRVMKASSARMIISMLEDAVRNGTAKKLADIGFPAAAKTGTVGYVNGGNTDAWTVAMTPTFSVAVWIGFDQPDENHLLSAGVTGGSYPAAIAAEFLKQTAAQSEGGQFQIPDGMNEVLIDRAALEALNIPMLASEQTPSEYILREILPDENIPDSTSRFWDAPKRVEAIHVQANESGQPVLSFVAPDSNAVYRVFRIINQKQTEVCELEGGEGDFITYTDTTLPAGVSAQYFIVSRQKHFIKEGRVWDSEPSAVADYQPPSMLERFFFLSPTGTEQPDRPLFFERQ